MESYRQLSHTTYLCSHRRGWHHMGRVAIRLFQHAPEIRHIEQEIQPRVFTHTDFNFKEPGNDLTASRKLEQKRGGPDFEIFDYPGEYTSLDEGEKYARTRIEEIQAGFETLQGETNARGISAGFTFDLTNHPRQDQQRSHLITSVSLSASTPGFYSGDTGEEGFSCSFTAMHAKQPYRVPRATPKPSIPGPQTAMVVGPSGEEIFTDEYGRVKVQFHWDRYGKADENSSCWIRVAQLWAGKKWGAMYIPRIGQEVIVEFLEGDPDQPIITGRVYNAQAMPPYDPKAKKTVSTIKSNSSKGGGGFNEIRFEDKKGEEQIFIHAEKNVDIRVKNDRFETIEHDCHLIVANEKFEQVKSHRNEFVEKNHLEEIGQDRNLTVKGKEDKEVQKDLILTVKGNVKETFKKDHTEDTTKNYTLKAMEVTIEAIKKIELKVGGSTISMGPAQIELKAPKVSVNGSAMTEVKGTMVKVNGSGMTDIKGAIVKIN